MNVKRTFIGENDARYLLMAAMVITSLLAWFTTYQVMSYATGQDPRIYIHLADQIRFAGYSSTAIATCASWVVPGYPLLLAVVLDTFGIFAAYWVNLPLFIVSLWPLAVMLRRFASPGETAITLLVFFGIIITGHPLNPHFLFLPFRGVVEWGLMFGVLAIAMPAFSADRAMRERILRAGGAGMLMLIGAAFRETVMFMCLPLLLLGSWSAMRGERGAWKVIGAMVLPLLVAFALYAVWRMSHGALLNLQAKLWLQGLSRGGYANPFSVQLMDILLLIRTELSPLGLVFLLIGTSVALWRREKEMLILLIMSALLILFYAMYKSHVRYTLSSVGLLGLVAGWGVAVSITFLTRKWRPDWERPIVVSVLAILSIVLVFAISRFETWGPRVGRSDVNVLIAHPVADLSHVFVEKDHRFLVDALLAFTKVAPKDPVYERHGITNFSGSYYLRPMNDGGGSAIQQGVKGEDWLRYYFDLVPDGLELVVGANRYEFNRIVPWTRIQHDVPIAVAGATRGAVLWLDFQSGHHVVGVTLQISANDHTLLATHNLSSPTGWVPCWIDPSWAAFSNLQVKVTSQHPLPETLNPTLVLAGEPRWFFFEQWRLPSTLSMIGDGFERRSMQVKHGASIVTNGTLRLPGLIGAPTNVVLSVGINAMPRPLSSGEIVGEITDLGHSSTSFTWNIRPRFEKATISWRGISPVAGEPLLLDVTIRQKPDDLWYVRLERMRLTYSITSD